jgi:hypothetical protein
VDYAVLKRSWDREVQSWEKAVTAHGQEPDADQWTIARARTLLALTEPREARRLSAEAQRAGGRRSRRPAWFVDLGRQARQPGVAVALLQLAAVAEHEGVEHLTEAREARLAATRARTAESALRYPRTRRSLSGGLVVLATLAVASLALHVLPSVTAGQVVAPQTWAVFWYHTVPFGLRPWLAASTLPWLVLPVTVASLVLWFRAPRSTTDDQPTRHPLERRAIQSVIGYVSVLVPFLVPVTAYGWVAGLRRYSPEALYPPRAVRTFALIIGTIGMTGCLLALWQIPAVRAPRLVHGNYAWDYRFIQQAQSAGLARLLDPWALATSNAYGSATTAEYTTVTALLAVLCAALLGCAGLDYVVRSPWGTAAMIVLLASGLVAAANAMVAYGMVGQDLAVDIAWAVVIVLFVRHRIRNRNRPRTQRG